MNSKLLSFLAILGMSAIGLLASGVFSEPRSGGVIAAAVIGTLVIALVIWLPLAAFLKAFQKREKK